MKIKPPAGSLSVASLLACALTLAAAEAIPPVPRFSTNYMDRAVPPGQDFYRFAAGDWVRQNPVPADKSRWSGFEELQQRNWFLIREILDTCAAERATSPRREVRQVGDFFASALDTNRLEQLGVHPLDADLARIAALASTDDLFRLLADFHRQGRGGLFGMGVSPDAKNSGFYGLYFSQGGLGLPSRDYYFEASFAKVRDQYRAHIARMLRFLARATPRPRSTRTPFSIWKLRWPRHRKNRPSCVTRWPTTTSSRWPRPLNSPPPFRGRATSMAAA